MLHTQERETVAIEVVNVNIKAVKAASALELEHLQKQRTKAGYARKPYWQKRIDEHFGLK